MVTLIAGGWLSRSFALVPLIGTEFLPSLDEGSIAVQTFRIPSISLPQSLELQNKAEKILKQFPEVIDVVSKTGRADIASDPDGRRTQRRNGHAQAARRMDHDEIERGAGRKNARSRQRNCPAWLPAFPNRSRCAWTNWSAA